MARSDPLDRPPSFLSAASLARELDMSESTVHDMVRRGVLPRPVKLSSGCVRWNWSDVQIALGSMMAPGEAAGDFDPFMQGARNAAQS